MPYHKKTHRNKRRHTKKNRTQHKKRNYRGGDEEKTLGHHIQAIGSKITSSITDLFKDDDKEKSTTQSVPTSTYVPRQPQQLTQTQQNTLSGGKRRNRRKSRKSHKKTNSRRRR